MAKSLIDKAKEFNRNKRKEDFSEQELELVTAWMNDEISTTQILHALNLKATGNIYAFLARGARLLYRQSKKE